MAKNADSKEKATTSLPALDESDLKILKLLR